MVKQKYQVELQTVRGKRGIKMSKNTWEIKRNKIRKHNK